jgi:hypothetical protein
MYMSKEESGNCIPPDSKDEVVKVWRRLHNEKIRNFMKHC